jgi:hypothetical protein
MRRPRRPAQELRFAIECLPERSRVAMLQGIEDNTIIVGAYTDRHGGVCPMLAAHRGGGRTSLASFARAWDRYTRAGRKAREASDREVSTLKAMLEASSLRDDSARSELARAVAELKEIKARRAEEQAREAADGAERAAAGARRDHAGSEGTRPERPAPDTGERDRSEELQHRPGWAWMRVFRRYDDYEAALERVERARRDVEQRELERV